MTILQGNGRNRLLHIASLLAMLAGPFPATAATRNWNAANISANVVTNLALPASWSGGALPTNGDDAFLVWTAGTNNRSQTLTNSPGNIFVADSLSITNSGGSGGQGSDAIVTFRGEVFLTNGPGRLAFAGLSGGNGNLSVTFSNNLTAQAIRLTGGAGAGVGTLTLGGVTQAGSLEFNGTTGNSRLLITGPLDLTDALIVTNLNANSSGTLAGNATVGRLIINNTANNRFTITNATLSVTGAVSSVAGGFNLAHNGTLQIRGTGGLILSNLAPTLRGTLHITNSTLTAKLPLSNIGTITLADGILTGDNLTNTASGTLTGHGTISSLFINQGRADFRGTIATNLLQTAGSFTLNGPASITGVATLSGGIFDLRGQSLTAGRIVNSGAALLTNGIAGALIQGPITNSGSLYIGADTTLGGPLHNAATTTVDGATLAVTPAWHNTGALLLRNGTLTGGVATNSGLIHGHGTAAAVLANLGTVIVTNGTLNLQTAPQQNGTLAVSGGSTLSAAVAWQNAGTLQLQGGTVAGAALTNAAMISGGGTISAMLHNLGGSTLLVPGGNTLVLTVAPQQAGTVNVLGTLQIVAAWANSAAGSVALSGGTLSGATLTNHGTLTGAGTLTEAPVNLGFLNVTGAVHVAPAWSNPGTVNVTGTLSGGAFTNLGTVTSAGHFLTSVVQAGGRFGLSGVSTLSAAATLTGGIMDLQGQRLVAGHLDVVGGALTNGVAGGTVQGHLRNSATVAFSADTFVAGVVSNHGAWWWRGAVSNNVVNAGTMTLSGPAVVTDTLTMQGGTLDLHGSTLKVGALAGAAGVLTDHATGAGTTTVTVAQAVNTTFGGVIQDGTTRALALLKSGPGILTLTGTNNFSGGTEVQGGTLKLGAAGTLPDTQTVLVNGGTFDLSGFQYSLAGVVLASGQIVGGVMTGAFYDVRSGLVASALAGNAGLTKTTAGTVTLAGSNTYTGGSSILEGTLLLAADERLANGGAVMLAGGTLNLGGFQETVGTVQLGGGTITNGTVTASAYLLQSGTMAATLAGSATATKTGTGTVWLTAASTYSGGTVVSGGTLRVNNTVGSGTGSGAVQVYNGGKLGGNGSISGPVSIHSGGRLAPGNSVGTNTVATLTLNSGSVLEFEFRPDLSANDFTIVTTPGGLTIHGGGLYLYQEDTTTTFDHPGIYQLIQYSGAIGGAGVGALSVLNPTLNRAYLFGTSAGHVVLNITGITGWDGEGPDAYWQSGLNWGGDVAPTTNDHLLFDGYTRLVNTNNFPVHSRFGGLTFTNTAGPFVLRGNAVHLTGNIYNYSANPQTISLPLVLDTWEPTIHAVSGNLLLQGSIGQTNGPLGLTKSGAHTAVLLGTNTYSGATVVQGGALRANDGVGLPSGSLLKLNGGVLEGNGVVTFSRSIGAVPGQVQWTGDGGFSAFGGTLTVNLGGAAGTVTWGSGGFVPADNKLLFSHSGADSTVRWFNPLDFNGGMRTIQVANGAAIVDVDFVGSLSGSGGWTKTGTGAAQISGTGSYSGATMVNAGTLIVNSSLTSGGGVWVNAGGTLAGTGTVNSAITVAGNGVMAPGQTGADIFRAAASLTLQSNFIYDWQLGIATNDVIEAGSLAFTLGDTWTLRLGTEPNVFLYHASSSNNVYVLMTWQSGPTPWGLTNAQFIGNGRFALGNAQVLIDETNQQVLLTGVWLIPEPNTLLLLYAGALTLWGYRRRLQGRRPVTGNQNAL